MYHTTPHHTTKRNFCLTAGLAMLAFVVSSCVGAWGTTSDALEDLLGLNKKKNPYHPYYKEFSSLNLWRSPGVRIESYPRSGIGDSYAWVDVFKDLQGDSVFLNGADFFSMTGYYNIGGTCP